MLMALQYTANPPPSSKMGPACMPNYVFAEVTIWLLFTLVG